MYFEIKEDCEIVKCIMSDEIIIEVPNTEKNEIPYIEIISILFLLSGLGIILYVILSVKSFGDFLINFQNLF